MTAPADLSTAMTPRSSAVNLSAPAVENGANPDDPSIPSAAYQRMKVRWEKTRACMIGTEAIRAGREAYLAPSAGENEQRYDSRVRLAAFYNGYARTVVASVGLLLDEEPTLEDDMPNEIVELWENVDGSGTAGPVFAKKLATNGIVDSYAGIFTDYERADSPTIDRSRASAAAVPGAKLSGDDEKRLGLRPYFVLFRADDVYQAHYENVNGVRTLTLLILREFVSERVGRFGVQTKTNYRVYTDERGVISYELWQSPDAYGGRPELKEPATRIQNQTEIPWSPFIAGDEIAPGEYKPSLVDLADLNIQYHNSLTNILSLQQLACVPTPVRIGAKPDANGVYPTLFLGPSNTIEAPYVQGLAQPVYWLSPQIDVLEPGMQTLTQTKADMGTMGAAFLSAETRAAETAEGKRIDSSASRATLGSISRALKDCLERACGFMAKYLNKEGGSITLNTDFTGEGIDPILAGVMVTAYQSGIFSLQELRHYLSTGQLPETFKADDIATILKQHAALDVPPEPDPGDASGDVPPPAKVKKKAKAAA